MARCLVVAFKPKRPGVATPAGSTNQSFLNTARVQTPVFLLFFSPCSGLGIRRSIQLSYEGLNVYWAFGRTDYARQLQKQ